MKTIPAAFAALSLFIVSCDRKAPEPEGRLSVRAAVAGKALADFAALYPRLKADFAVAGSAAAPTADLAFAEKGRPLDNLGGSKGIAYAPGALRCPEGVRALEPFSGAGKPGDPDLPAASYWYALWYDPERLEALGIHEPRSFADLEASLPVLERAGLTPIALGAAYGWPLALWFSYADLRLNGGAAYEARLAGTKRYDDADAVRAMEIVLSLGKAKAFGPAPEKTGWEEAWQALLDGKAGFCLMGSFALDRTPPGRRLRAVAVPALKGGSRDAGELATVLAFRVSAAGTAPERALGFAAAYAFAGAPGLADGRSLAQAYIRKETPLGPGEAILDATRRTCPPMERGLATQASYDAMRLFAELAAGQGNWSAADACARLERIRKAGSPMAGL